MTGVGLDEDERGEGRFANRPYQRWLICRWFVCEAMTVTAGGNEGGMTEGDGFPPRLRGNNAKGAQGRTGMGEECVR